MARPEKPIDNNGGFVSMFANDLRKLRARSGNPTYREMARSALFSPSVLSSAASGARLPTLQVTLGFVAACGGDVEEWRRRWMQVANDSGVGAGANTRNLRSGAKKEIPPPAQLPLRHCNFIDRGIELDRLCRIIPPTPIVITGLAGACQSDFAVHYGHRMAAKMIDGQLYADLGSLSGTELDARYVIDGFLGALGVPADQRPETLDQRAALYRSILVDRRLVVVLDNVRKEQQVRPLLTKSQRSVTVLVSSMPLLGLGNVQRIRLGALSRVDSIAMITAAIPDRVEHEPQESDRLAELCCDIPLALDIALRKLIARPNMPIRRVNARLVDPHRALNWLWLGDVSLHQSLKSAYQEVSAEARDFLVHISKGRLDHVPDSDMYDQDEPAEQLWNAGLIRHDDRFGFYQVDRLVRAFASRQETQTRSRESQPLRIEISAYGSHPGSQIPDRVSATQ